MGVDLKTPVGRADLTRLVARAGSERERNAYARLCGFEPELLEEDVERPVTGAPAVTREPETRLVATAPERTTRLGLWRVVEAEITEEEDDRSDAPEWFTQSQPITRAFLRAARQPPGRAPLLAPWSRLWPFLRRELSVAGPGRALDTQRVVRLVALCRPLRSLPRRRVRRWASSIELLVDTARPLRPFSTDMDELKDRLGHLCGRHRLRVTVLPAGLAAPGYRPGLPGTAGYKVQERRAAVLAVSDLGAYSGDSAAVQRASEIGREVIRAGGQAVALMPCPPWRWPRVLGHSWRMAWWDLGRRPQVMVRHRLEAGRAEPRADSASAGLVQLLRLVSPLVRPDPELIRSLRALLPVRTTDAGMESDISYGRHDLSAHLAELPSLPLELRRQLVALLIRFHTGYPEILDEELCAITDVDPDLLSDELKQELIDDVNARIAVSLDRRRWRELGFSEAEFLGYLRRREARLPEGAYQDERVAASWVLAHLQDDGNLDTDDIPASLPVPEVAWAFKPGVRRWYQLAQVGRSLVVQPEGSDDERGSRLGAVPSTTGVLFVKALQRDGLRMERPDSGTGSEARSKRLWQLHERGPEILEPEHSGQRYALESPCGRVILEQLARPDWAREIGRDRDGLFVRLYDGRRCYWLNPGKQQVRDSSWVVNRKGIWIEEEKHRQVFDPEAFLMRMREHLGEDEHGLYEVVEIAGVHQVFRWIPPGEFLMGSAPGEPERFDNELQHEVVLTRGFWLADTACTQGLWQAVMGENPSRFKGAERPVENVSWEDCQQFLERVNHDRSGLGFRLPTEAEWEYACRAGTTTPFWFGSNVSTDQVNFDGNLPYAGGPKGHYRHETVAVKSLPVNDWGLHEMHGNVWEWCADRLGPYKEGKAIDPQGPENGDGRVLRGGSWLDGAGACRSASRFRFDPGIRYEDIGFRLARGQEEKKRERDQEQEQGAVRTKVERSGAGVARREPGLLERLFRGSRGKKE